MTHTRKPTLWYNPEEKDTRRGFRENDLVRMAADREGRSLLESYCRLYRQKL